jgi:hypothetical protein
MFSAHTSPVELGDIAIVRALIGVLLVVGFVVAYWLVILAALAVAVAAWLAWCGYRQHLASVERSRRAGRPR